MRAAQTTCCYGRSNYLKGQPQSMRGACPRRMHTLTTVYFWFRFWFRFRFRFWFRFEFHLLTLFELHEFNLCVAKSLDVVLWTKASGRYMAYAQSLFYLWRRALRVIDIRIDYFLIWRPRVTHRVPRSVSLEIYFCITLVQCVSGGGRHLKSNFKSRVKWIALHITRLGP